MAHFARINDDNIVEEVIVVSNDDCGGGEYPDSEPVGQAFIASLGLEGEWKQTSYNNNFRGHFGAVGSRYDAESDVFIPYWWSTTCGEIEQ